MFYRKRYNRCLCYVIASVFLFPVIVVSVASARDFLLGTTDNSLTCKIFNNDNSGYTIFEYTSLRDGTKGECVLFHSFITNCRFKLNGKLFKARSDPGFGKDTTSRNFTASLNFEATRNLNGGIVKCFGPENNVNDNNLVASWHIQIIDTLNCTVCDDDGSGTTVYRYRKPGDDYKECSLSHNETQGTTRPCGAGSPFNVIAGDGYTTENDGYYVSSFQLNESEDPSGMTIQCFGQELSTANETIQSPVWNITLDQSFELDSISPEMIAPSFCTFINQLATSQTSLPASTPISMFTPEKVETSHSGVGSLYDINILLMLLVNTGVGFSAFW